MLEVQVATGWRTWHRQLGPGWSAQCLALTTGPAQGGPEQRRAAEQEAGGETLFYLDSGPGQEGNPQLAGLALEPSGTSLNVTLESPAEGGPNQHNPAPPCPGGAP